jgi:hypothetical protein
VISEIIVRRDGAIIHAVLHWQGGDHTELQVKQRLNAAGRHNPRIPDGTIALMRELARLMPDRQIARLLNRIGVEPAMAMRGRWSVCAASANTTKSRPTAMAEYDRAANASPRRDQRQAGLPRRSLGSQGCGPGRTNWPDQIKNFANTKH